MWFNKKTPDRSLLHQIFPYIPAIITILVVYFFRIGKAFCNGFLYAAAVRSNRHEPPAIGEHLISLLPGAGVEYNASLPVVEPAYFVALLIFFRVAACHHHNSCCNARVQLEI